MIFWKQLSAIESLFGKKSQLITTGPNGQTRALPLQPMGKLSGMGKITFPHLVDNDLAIAIAAELNALAAEGWQMRSVATTELTAGYAVLTHYLLSKEVAD